MQFTISAETFLNLVSTAAPVIPARPVLPVLANLLLTADDGELRVTGTNMDQTIRMTGEAAVIEPGAITVNAKRLTALLREMPHGELAVRVVKDKFTVSYHNGKAEVQGLPATEFPSINGLGEDFDCAEAPVTGEAFRQLADMGGFCPASDRTRMVLTGVLLEIGEGTVAMVSTDGHRLARVALPVDSGETTVSAILPSEAVSAAVKLCGQMELRSLGFGKGAVRFIFANAVLLTKTVEGPYPNFKQVIPVEHQTLFVTETDSFAQSVRRVDVLSNIVTRQIELRFGNDAATLCTANADIGGESRETVAGTYGDEESRLGLNAGYLAEILKRVATPLVRLEMNGESGACIIRPDGECGVDALFLIMPLRLND